MCAYVCLSVFKSTTCVWNPMEVIRDIGSLQTGVTDGCELLSEAGKWIPVLWKNSAVSALNHWVLLHLYSLTFRIQSTIAENFAELLIGLRTNTKSAPLIALYSTCLKYKELFLSDIFIVQPMVTGIWPNFLHTLRSCLWKVKIFFNGRSLWMSKKPSVFRLSSVSLTKSRKCVKVK